jgi:hypothetical protein
VAFLYPAFLLGALAVAVPIVLHLLRRDVAPEVRFSAVRLLKKSPVERSRRRRLRDLLLLAARVTALLLLAAAFARPFAPGAASAMLPLRVIAVDRSFSMAAPGAFDRALALARAAVDEAAFGERIAVIAFDERAQVVAPPGGQGEARAALATLRPGAGATRYAAAVTKAAELASGGAGRLILITDMRRTGWEGEPRARVPASLQVELRAVEAPAGNAGLVDARVESGGIVASIRNASPTALSGTVTLARDGQELARAQYEAAAGATTDARLEWPPTPGPITLSIVDAPGFPADDVRHVLVGNAADASVMVIAGAEATGVYLRQALDVGEGELATLRPRVVRAGDIAGGQAEAIRRNRALVLLSTRGLDRAAREQIAAFVRTGGGLVIAASPDVESEIVTSIFGWPAGSLASAAPRPASLTVTDMRHPIFRPFGAFAANLGGVRFSRAWRIDGSPWQVIARFDDGAPALAERSEGLGRIVVFASDLDRRWNDFPLHPSFVPFVTETLRHVAAATTPGDSFMVGRVPAGVPPTPGVHRLESGRMVAVNVDPRETATTIVSDDDFMAMIEPTPGGLPGPQVQAAQTESRQNLWQYGLLLMLGVLAAESLVGRRT